MSTCVSGASRLKNWVDDKIDKNSCDNHMHFFQDFYNAETISVVEMIKKIGKSISKYCRVSQIPIAPCYTDVEAMMSTVENCK